MTTSSEDGEFEEDHEPAGEPASGDDAPEAIEATHPKPKSIIHIDDIIAKADERDEQRSSEGKMMIGRYRDISRQKADGKDPQLSAIEQAQYDETHESMQELGRNLSKTIMGPNSDIAKKLMAPYANINKKLADSMAQTAGIQNAFKQSTKPISNFQAMIKPPAYEIPKPYEPPANFARPTPASAANFSQLFDNSEHLKSIEKANEERNKREEGDRQVAATHLEATQQMVASMAEQATASERMSNHQKTMNWWILGSTIVAGVVGIIALIFSVTHPG